ncbi:MAG: folylpolyglutamate synthase/dihydrofolate synthase family protein [Candidatus Thermoplasmatota archaeon]
MNEADALALLDGRARFGMKPGLATIDGMLSVLDDFHQDLKVVHVAGTNGKGSVCAMIAAALEAAGHRTGLYTSPHLIRFHERIRVNGTDITGKQLAAAMDRIKPALDKFPEATYFEVATVLALRHFVDAGVAVAVLEVGLGGRLDATNVYAKPLVTIVTNISLEHTEVLGNTKEAIAREKGGIIKPGAPLVTGASGNALQELRALAIECGSSARVLGDDFVPIAGSAELDGQTFDVDGLREYGPLRIPLVGEHQIENAALALAALDAIDASGLRVPIDAARRGLDRTRWPGRLQRIPGKPTLLLDGAHNPAGMLALVSHLERMDLKPVVVFGALMEKDWALMVEMLAPRVRDAIVTRVPTPRSVDPMEPARMFSQMGVFGMVVDEPGHALRTAEGIAGPSGIVLVTGSLYLVGEIMARLEER